MPEPHPFRVAAETKDLDLMRETLAEDVTFHSPVVFKAYEGREMTMVILSNVIEIFEDFRYLDEARGDGTVVLRFAARVGDIETIAAGDHVGRAGARARVAVSGASGTSGASNVSASARTWVAISHSASSPTNCGPGCMAMPRRRSCFRRSITIGASTPACA